LLSVLGVPASKLMSYTEKNTTYLNWS